MANTYQIHIEDKHRNGRYFTVITNTLQNAMSIGRCQCRNGEYVVGVHEAEKDVYIDYDVIDNERTV